MLAVQLAEVVGLAVIFATAFTTVPTSLLAHSSHCSWWPVEMPEIPQLSIVTDRRSSLGGKTGLRGSERFWGL